MSQFKLYPQVVIWEITFACNMRCVHCGTSAGSRREEEMNTTEALALIDELHSLGTEAITLSGGEPLVRSDWPELARHIKELGMKVYLITNGFSVDQENIAIMKSIGFDNVGVSLDGVPETHNYIRQNKRSFNRAVHAMKMMDEAGMKFCALTQVSNINIRELDDLYEILSQVNCPVWRIQMTTPTGRMSREWVLTTDGYQILVDKILELQKRGGINIDVGENIGYFGCKGTELLEGMPYFGCYAGTRVVGIESNGNIKGCLSMPEEFVEGNLKDSSFTEIWNNPEGFAYNRKFTRDTAEGECHDCKYLPLCRGGCTTTSVAATGSRANNPYCMYRLEKNSGIACQDPEAITELLKHFD